MTAIRLTVAADQLEDVRLSIAPEDGSVVASVRKGLLSRRAQVAISRTMLALSDYVYVPLPDHLREQSREAYRRELAERVAALTPEERAQHDARQQVIAEMMDKLDALEAAAS